MGREALTGPGEVRLRPVEDADVPVFFAHHADPVAWRMAAFPPRDRAAFDAHWARIRADPTVILRAIELDGRLAGNVLSFVRDGRREVGYWLGREAWGRGVASRALARFVAHEDSTRPLHAGVAKTNAASIRVLEKCGFVRRGETRFQPPGGEPPVEDWLYELPAPAEKSP